MANLTVINDFTGMAEAFVLFKVQPRGVEAVYTGNITSSLKEETDNYVFPTPLTLGHVPSAS
jgi:hypothetical protein